MEIVKLCIATVLPIIFCVILVLIDRRKIQHISRISYARKQIYIGILFGSLAVFSTEFSIEIGGAIINARDSAPLCAGLIFGGPAGIIAGTIGGVFRWIAAIWGVGVYTRLGCSIATILSGIIAALLRKFLFDNKKPSWIYGIAIGMAMEVLHVLLIFLTNMRDIKTAFFFVKKCCIGLIGANTIPITLSLLIVSLIVNDNKKQTNEKKRISQTFQRYLLLCVFVAFWIVSSFIYYIQSQISYTDVDKLMSVNVEDVRRSVDEASDKNLLSLTKEVVKEMKSTKVISKESIDKKYSSKDDDGKKKKKSLDKIAKKFNISEINVIDKDGIILFSTQSEFFGYDMNSGEQSMEFMKNVKEKNEYAQKYQPISYNKEISRKYAGVTIYDDCYVQVGYDAIHFHKDLENMVKDCTKNHHIGQDGYMIISGEEGKIFSDRKDHNAKKLKDINITIDSSTKQNVRNTATIYNKKCYYSYVACEGYNIICVVPQDEAMLARDISVYVICFMQIIVFTAVFVLIFYLIKKVVVDNMYKINNALSKITCGNLDVVVDVKSNQEFYSLSHDINTTVDTLKRYIKEAEERIDKELEFARSIQYAVLPTKLPKSKEFEIFASMDTAKEVGGDFYDFYYINETTFAILIADVSGKGIPAAMFMMNAKATIKSFAQNDYTIDEVFTLANKKLCEGNDADMFVTAWMAFIDIKSGNVQFVNAGHNPPLIKKKDGKFDYFRTKAGLVLAGMDGFEYKKQEFKLDKGDTIYLYTDGVTEANNIDEVLFNEDRLKEKLNELEKDSSPEHICRHVKIEVDKFAGEQDQFDDITMLCFKLKD